MVRKLVLAALLVTAVNVSASAQIGLGRIKEAAKKAVSASDSAKKKAESEKAKADSAKAPAAAATESAKGAGASTASVRANAKVWENYDFVPGSKVMFFTDFSEDKVGNVARRLKYLKGPVEVVERDDVKMLRATGLSEVLIPLGRKLPERFTLEFDVISTGYMMNRALSFEGGPRELGNQQSATIFWNPMGAWRMGSGGNMGNTSVNVPDEMREAISGQLAHVRVLMDGAYFKMYVNERRLYNVPELAFARDTVIRVLMEGSDETPVYIASIRVAESDTDVLYDALANKGRWATQGILFETGKSDLRPESRPVLKEIASTMKKYGDLKIMIEGHTDNVGAAASNLSLSDARAAAVKAALVADFAVDGSRITTKGLGDTKPIMPNTTSEGRAQNRRVEIVKQ